MKQEPIVVLIELYQLHSPVWLSFRRYRYSQLLDRSNVHRLFEAFLTLSLNAPNFHHTTKKTITLIINFGTRTIMLALFYYLCECIHILSTDHTHICYILERGCCYKYHIWSEFSCT